MSVSRSPSRKRPNAQELAAKKAKIESELAAMDEELESFNRAAAAELAQATEQPVVTQAQPQDGSPAVFQFQGDGTAAGSGEGGIKVEASHSHGGNPTSHLSVATSPLPTTPIELEAAPSPDLVDEGMGSREAEPQGKQQRGGREGEEESR